MDYNFYFKDLRNIKQNLIKIYHHISNLCCYISVNKVPKGLKIKITPQTPGIKTNIFYRRWNIILFECSTRFLKLFLDDASYQKKGLEKIFSDLLKTSEEQLSTDDFTNIWRRLDEIQKLEDTKCSSKRDAKFKRDGIKPKTPIDSTEDTVVRKTRTRGFRRKTKAENRKSNVVVNLSSKPLNSAELSLLSKGLNFCPNPPKLNVRELDEDLDQFARRLRIKEYFHSKKETSEDLSTDESDIKEVIDIPRFVKKSN
jgi:hypothetical protein